MTILEYLSRAKNLQMHDRDPAICDNDLDDMIIQAEREERRNDGCGWCKEFGAIPLRGFTLHGCTSTTVEYCPMCGKHLVKV